jgi:hypothetical protein
MVMSEYEYEVRFYGSQWVINILCYHEQDSEVGDSKIINWAVGVADQNGLTIPEYESVTVTKVGELV